jgi:hypothetical protein
MDMQAMINGLGQKWQEERSITQMTLGGLIDRIQSLPEDIEIDQFEGPHSYRGYYVDLAFEKKDGKFTKEEALALCRSAMGEVYEGYKGGEFQMGKKTPVWLSYYGQTGQKIMNVNSDGTLQLADDI